MKKIIFLGNSLAMLRKFPEAARKEAGMELWRIQQGLDPHDWKPITSIGSGVREIRIRDLTRAFRVFYITKIGDVIYVLHAFPKKTRKTPKQELDITAARLKAIKETTQ